MSFNQSGHIHLTACPPRIQVTPPQQRIRVHVDKHRPRSQGFGALRGQRRHARHPVHSPVDKRLDYRKQYGCRHCQQPGQDLQRHTHCAHSTHRATSAVAYTGEVTLCATADGTSQFAARFPAFAQRSFYRPAQGRTVSSLGLGTYLGNADEPTDRAYEAAIQAAVRGGINLLDTAINYRHQRSEQSMGQALKQLFASGEVHRAEVVVCTKAGFLTPGAVPQTVADTVAGMHSMHPDFIADQIERSRANLQLETLDVFYLHNPETQLRFVSASEFDDRIRRAFLRLEELVSRGQIAFYGTATWSGFRLKQGESERLDLKRLIGLAHDVAGDDHHFRFIQLPVNLAMPEAFTYSHADDHGQPQSVLEVAVRAGMTVIASASLLQARLARDLPETLAAAFPGTTTDAARAIQFTRSTPGVTTALIGMSQLAHVENNLSVAALDPLTADQFLGLFRRDA